VVVRSAGAVPEDLTRENGKRTFALSELMIIEGYTGRGIAHRLDELLSARQEQRATLACPPEQRTRLQRLPEVGLVQDGPAATEPAEHPRLRHPASGPAPEGRHL